MGPEAATSFPGQQVGRAWPHPDGTRPAARARPESDDGRRGCGYSFGAVTPAAGAALTAPYDGRTLANGVDFLAQGEAGSPAAVARV